MNNRQEVFQIGKNNILFSFSKNDYPLFIAMGSLLAEIQSFETSIAFILSNLKVKREENTEFEEIMKKNTKITLGQLANAFKSYLDNEVLANKLIEIRNKRNHFVHEFLRSYQWPYMDEDSYMNAIKEINEISTLVQNLEPKLFEYLNDEQLLDIKIIELPEL